MMKPLSFASLFLAMLLLFPFSARAHRLSVFAWVEGDTAHVEGKFAGGKSVQGGTVMVKGPDGENLITGETDDQGTFSFRIPRKADLKVVVSAGMGHQGDWTIRAEEIENVQSEAGKDSVENARDDPPEDGTVSASKPAPVAPDDARPADVSPAAIQKAVEQALDKKLNPIIRMLADQRNAVSATEIFGGIGYIFGLVGVAAYVASRKKSGAGETGR